MGALVDFDFPEAALADVPEQAAREREVRVGEVAGQAGRRLAHGGRDVVRGGFEVGAQRLPRLQAPGDARTIGFSRGFHGLKG